MCLIHKHTHKHPMANICSHIMLYTCIHFALAPSATLSLPVSSLNSSSQMSALTPSTTHETNQTPTMPSLEPTRAPTMPSEMTTVVIAAVVTSTVLLLVVVVAVVVVTMVVVMVVVLCKRQKKGESNLNVIKWECPWCHVFILERTNLSVLVYHAVRTYDVILLIIILLYIHKCCCLIGSGHAKVVHHMDVL